MNKRIVPSIFGSALLVTLLASATAAQVQRTFVSGSGNDGNPCSRIAPCRTFGQAISQTNPGGEVIVLDSAGYGPVTITQSVSITAPPGVYAGISVFSGDGIDINGGGSDKVTLRGLTVNNQGSTGNGVVYNTGSKLHMENCVINGFSNFGSVGLVLHNNLGATVEVIDSVVRGNFFGILELPGGSMQVTIDHVRLEANSTGLDARGGSKVTVTNSVAANNGGDAFDATSFNSDVQMNVERTTISGNIGGISALATGAAAVQVNVRRCVISGNLFAGIGAQSNSTGVATARVSGSTVTGNGTGLSNNGSPALLLSRGDNTVEGNTTNTSGTIGTYTAK